MILRFLCKITNNCLDYFKNYYRSDYSLESPNRYSDTQCTPNEQIKLKWCFTTRERTLKNLWKFRLYFNLSLNKYDCKLHLTDAFWKKLISKCPERIKYQFLYQMNVRNAFSDINLTLKCNIRNFGDFYKKF